MPLIPADYWWVRLLMPQTSTQKKISAFHIKQSPKQTRFWQLFVGNFFWHFHKPFRYKISYARHIEKSCVTTGVTDKDGKTTAMLNTRPRQSNPISACIVMTAQCCVRPTASRKMSSELHPLQTKYHYKIDGLQQSKQPNTVQEFALWILQQNNSTPTEQFKLKWQTQLNSNTKLTADYNDKNKL